LSIAQARENADERDGERDRAQPEAKAERRRPKLELAAADDACPAMPDDAGEIARSAERETPGPVQISIASWSEHHPYYEPLDVIGFRAKSYFSVMSIVLLFPEERLASIPLAPENSSVPPITDTE
jgi:hypothetical protein